MASIRQKPTPQSALTARVLPPDFRNLGVALRALLVVNFLLLLTVWVRNQQVANFPSEFLDAAGLVEFPLLLALLIAYFLAPAMTTFSYKRASISMVILAIACVAIASPLLAAFAPSQSHLRWMMWAAGAAGVVMIYFHWRASAAAPALAEARVLALNARIRPHFFFNSLNGVLGVMRSDPRRAETALEALADLFRALMQENRQLVPLEEEIEISKRYLELERLRLGDRLSVDWDLRHCPMDAMVPPLMLQPLIENAVYHGIEPSPEPGDIKVRVGQRGRDLIVRISNPIYAQARHQQGNRMAQANIRERLMLFFDIEASMEAGARDGRYMVNIRMPLRREEHK